MGRRASGRDGAVEPEIVERGQLLLVGRFAHAGYADIGPLWEAFSAEEPQVPAAVPGAAYELHEYPPGYRCGDRFWLHIGLEVTHLEPLPPPMAAKLLPPQRYAVFTHRLADGGFEGANQPIADWFATATYEPAADYDLQVYDERFHGPDDPGSLVAFWVPVRPKAT